MGLSVRFRLTKVSKAGLVVAVMVLATMVGVLGFAGSGFADAAELPAGGLVGTLSPGSTLIDCGQAATNVTVTAATHLDPSCTYTGGFRIEASDVVFDCQGAVIDGTPGVGQGIMIQTPAAVALSNVTVRNCVIRGFRDNLRVRRIGALGLPEGGEYDTPTSNILIENSLMEGSGVDGVFIDGFVTGVTLRNLEVRDAAAVGIYLNAGSKDNVVENSFIHGNGFEAAAESTSVIFGTTFRHWGTGREGIAIDGSGNNRIVGNTISGNSYGAVFLYKNCGEYGGYERRFGSDGNTIESNTITGEPNGVWIASRMAENLALQQCSDPVYVTEPGRRIHLDYAAGNTVRNNRFENVQYGVRVEDDDNTVTGNDFTSTDPSDQAIIVGTRWRTTDLDRPVTGTRIEGNAADIAGNSNPYRWIWGETATTYGADNLSFGTAVGWCEGLQPPINKFIFVKQFEADDADDPPMATTSTVPALDACAAVGGTTTTTASSTTLMPAETSTTTAGPAATSTIPVAAAGAVVTSPVAVPVAVQPSFTG